MRTEVPLLAALLLACGCPDQGSLDDDDATPPLQDDDDDDDSAAFEFSGQVTFWDDGSPAAGVDVGVAGIVTTTDEAGDYRVALADGPPQQVDFYDSSVEVTSYADCELVHDHSVWRQDERAGRGGALTVTVLLRGLTDPDGLRGTWRYEEAATGWGYLESVGPDHLDENSDGETVLVLQADPATRWWLTLAQLDGTLVAWTVESGSELLEDRELEATLLSTGLEEMTWDGAASELVTGVQVGQVVEVIDGYSRLALPVLEVVPDGAPRPMPVVADAPLLFEVDIQRSDMADCSWHNQQWVLEAGGLGETLAVPELFDVPRLESALDTWSFVPEVVWSGFPDDPLGWTSAYLWVFPPDGGSLGWTLRPGAVCGPKSATWPVGLPSIPSDSFGIADAWYLGVDRSANCSYWLEWGPL